MDSVKYGPSNPQTLAEAYARADRQKAEFDEVLAALDSSIDAGRVALNALIKERERVGIALGRIRARAVYEWQVAQGICQ
jgi:hypothetical protein